MWDGETSGKKKISLGGKKKVNTTMDKEDFLKKAAEERAGRALQRLQVTSATKIQGVYRGYRDVCRKRMEVEIVLDKKLADVYRLKAVLAGAGVTFIPPRLALQLIVREYLFVAGKTGSRGSNAQNRFSQVVSLLLDSMMAKETNYLELLHSPSSDATCAVLQLRGIVRMVLSHLHGGPHTRAFLSPDILSKVIPLLDLLSNPPAWGNGKINISENTFHQVMKIFYQPPNKRSNSNHVLFKIARELILESSTMHTDETSRKAMTSVLLNCIFLSLGISRDGGWFSIPSAMQSIALECYAGFVQEILSIPGLLDLPAFAEWPHRSALNRSPTFWKQILTVSEANHLAMSPPVIGNLLQLCSTSGSIVLEDSSDPELLAQFIGLVCRGISRLPMSSFQITADVEPMMKMEVESENEDNIDDAFGATEQSAEEHPLIREWKASKKRRISSSIHDDRLDPVVVSQLRLLLEPTFISMLFDRLLPPSAVSISTASVGRRNMSFQLCSLYCNILVKWGAVENVKSSQTSPNVNSPVSSILNALSFSNPHDLALKRIWYLLTTSADMELYARDTYVADASPAISAMLTLFSLSFSHLLIALDDQHLFVHQYPFDLSVLKSMVGILRTLLYRLIWASNKATVTDETLHLMTAACRLYNQLYERNCRHVFCPEDLWHWKGISAEQFSFSGLVNKTATLVLDTIPQVVPFSQRLEILSQLIAQDHSRRDARDPGLGVGLTIRRDFIYEDSFSAFNSMIASGSAERLKSRFQVSFINEHGLREAGIDGGGLFKDYIDTLAKHAFDPRYGLFRTTADGLLYPNPEASLFRADNIDHFKFLGRVLGKAVYEGILVEPQFAGFFLNKLLGKVNLTDDLQSLDPELYSSLMRLKTYSGNWEELCLFFDITTSEFGEAKTVELIPGGSYIPVTAKNVIRYISLVCNYRLNIQSEQQCRAFLKGFQDIIPIVWMRMFNSVDLQHIIGGTSSKIDLEDLARCMTYTGGFDREDRWIKWFWEAIVSFSDDEQRLLLKFMTSCSRAPLLGFKQLYPPPSLQRINISKDSERLPTSATCMNTLKLPTYSSASVLREKLLYAISSSSGFDLT